MLCFAKINSKNGPRCDKTKIENSNYCLKHHNLKIKNFILKWGDFIEIKKERYCKLCLLEKENKNFNKYSTKYDNYCKNCRKKINKIAKENRNKNFNILKTISSNLTNNELKFIIKKFQSLKKSASKRKFIWKLNIKDVFKIVIKSCNYCNKFNEYKINTLGRIDAKIGYTLDNIIPICNMCVIFKNKFSSDILINRAKHICTFNNLGNFGLFSEVFYNSKSKKYYNAYKKRAGNDFKLSKEEFKTLINGNCRYCGKISNTDNTNGIDRINSKLRLYSTENTYSCCKTCNKLKYIFSEKKFFDKCLEICLNN